LIYIGNPSSKSCKLNSLLHFPFKKCITFSALQEACHQCMLGWYAEAPTSLSTKYLDPTLKFYWGIA